MEMAQTYRWTREKYELLAEAGILGEDERIELIDGFVVEISPQNAPHSGTVTLVQEALSSAFPVGYSVRVQLPLLVSEASSPEPDISVVAGSTRDYMQEQPVTAVLAVEVADASLFFDREVKHRVYAEAGSPEYWIVNLPEQVVEIYREPAGGRYRLRLLLDASDTIAPLARPDYSISIADLLP